jgi:hypothetical protein
MHDDNAVAALAVTLVFGAPCAVWLVTRLLSHQERMEMLRRGFTPPPNSRDWHRAMRRGWAPPPSQAANGYDYSANYAAQYHLRRGIQVAFVGLALLIGLGFIGYRGDGMFTPGPWLLGGLIPLFVGIAQVVSAVAAGASFGAPLSQQRMAPPPGAAPGPGVGAGTVRDTSGGWRPGSLPEIEPPVSPPDRT